MKALIFFLAFIIGTTCPAAEIVAWKVPLEAFLNRPLPEEKISRLSSPPGESPFFHKGDELWDLKKLPAKGEVKDGISPDHGRLETSPPLEWVVWNATTRRLVTKCEWNGVSQLHLRLDPGRQPIVCKISADLFEVPPDGAQPKPESVPTMTLSWLTRSGAPSQASARDASGMISCKGTTTFERGMRAVELDFRADCALKNQLKMSFQSRFGLQSGVSTWVARDFTNGKGMDLYLTATLVLLDGTPVDESMLIQRGDGSAILAFDSQSAAVHEIAEGLWLATYEESAEMVAHHFGPYNPDGDPFAELSATADRAKTFFSKTQVPGQLDPWFTNPIWSLQEEFKGLGLSPGNEDRCGYAPTEARLFLLSDKPAEISKFETLWTWACRLPLTRISITTGDPPQSRIVCSSGTRASIQRSVPDGKIVRSFAFEPSVVNSYDQVDLHAQIWDGPEEMPSHAVRTATTLNMGRPQTLLSTNTGGALQVTAESDEVNAWALPASAVTVPNAKLPDE